MKFLVTISLLITFNSYAFAENSYSCLSENQYGKREVEVTIDQEKGILRIRPDGFNSKYIMLPNYSYRPSPLCKNFTAFRAKYRGGITRTIFVENTLLNNESQAVDSNLVVGRISSGGWDLLNPRLTAGRKGDRA